MIFFSKLLLKVQIKASLIQSCLKHQKRGSTEILTLLCLLEATFPFNQDLNNLLFNVSNYCKQKTSSLVKIFRKAMCFQTFDGQHTETDLIGPFYEKQKCVNGG